MKIICIEEHTTDLDIAKATQQAQEAEAGYMADWGSRVKEEPTYPGERSAAPYPYVTLTGARDFLERLPVSQDDKEKIAHRNAETLFRL